MQDVEYSLLKTYTLDKSLILNLMHRRPIPWRMLGAWRSSWFRTMLLRLITFKSLYHILNDVIAIVIILLIHFFSNTENTTPDHTLIEKQQKELD